MQALTIEDIAKLAGVSKTTVSRVLNNSSLVNKHTKDKVNEIIREYDFYPSHAARTLSNRSSGTLAVIVSEINNEYFGNLLLGVAEVADKKGLTMMIFNSDNSYEKEREIFEVLRGYYVKGVLYTPSIEYKTSEEEAVIANYLNKMDVPVVLIDREMKNYLYDGVYFNDKNAMHEGTRYLILKGHRRIGVISGSFEGSLIRNRDEGVNKALSEAGIKLNKEDDIRCNYTVNEAYRMTLARFDKPDPPTAFLLGNNQIALGFLKAIHKLNLELNKDVTCIGIDKIPAIDYIDYGYSFIERDSKDMGVKAIELLLHRIEFPEEKINSIFLPTIVNLRMN